MGGSQAQDPSVVDQCQRSKGSKDQWLHRR